MNFLLLNVQAELFVVYQSIYPYFEFGLVVFQKPASQFPPWVELQML